MLRRISMRSLLLVGLLLVAACETAAEDEVQGDGRGPATAPPTRAVLEPLPPVAYAVSGSDLILFFPFDGDGYCLGQFTAAVQETAEVVEVGDVEEAPVRGEQACAGVGTVGSTASVALPLARPLGERTVIRKTDGSRLRLRSG
jgi:hypothetical protein